MQDFQGAPRGAEAQVHPSIRLTSVALRGVGQVCDLQMTAARMLLRSQARAMAAFGWPDVTGLFNSADERTRNLYATAAEQMVRAAQRAGEAATELQREVSRLVDTQAAMAVENWQRGLEEIGTQAEQGLNELCETTRRTAEEAAEATRTTAEATRETLREGGTAVRHAVRESADATRAAMRESGDATRQVLREAGQVVQQVARTDGDGAGLVAPDGSSLAQHVAETARQPGREAGDAAPRHAGPSGRERKAA